MTVPTDSRPQAMRQYRMLVERATAGYRTAGRFAHGFAKGKLRGDPAFAHLLSHGLLTDRPRILDIGCGQGLLAALLLAADDLARDGRWPTGWPAPPASPRVHGIELMASDVDRAVRALGARARIVCGDMIDAPYSDSDAVVILDVLHYVDFAAQDRVLDRVRACLRPGGRLLLRVGDAAGGWRFRASQLVDHVVFLCRGHPPGRLYCRSAGQWIQALQQREFGVQSLSMSAGTPFANTLLTADLPS